MNFPGAFYDTWKTDDDLWWPRELEQGDGQDEDDYRDEESLLHAAESGMTEDYMTVDEYLKKPEARTDDDIFTMPLSGMTETELVSAFNRVTAELKRRDGQLEKDRALVRKALGLPAQENTPKPVPAPRATRKDKGTTRVRNKSNADTQPTAANDVGF